MKKETIIKNLKLLKGIEPRKDFSATSKMLILSHQRSVSEINTVSIKSERKLPKLEIKHFFKKVAISLSFSTLAIALIFAIFYATRELSPFFLPGLNEKRIVAEAEMINSQINIQLSQIEQFQKTSQKGNEALRQAASNQLNHLNEIIINKEAKKEEVNFSKEILENNNKINQILKSISE